MLIMLHVIIGQSSKKLRAPYERATSTLRARYDSYEHAKIVISNVLGKQAITSSTLKFKQIQIR